MAPNMPEEQTAASLGLDNSTVLLTKRHGDWKIAFQEEAQIIRNALDYPELAIEHIGSTSIQDLDAKPILDIMLGIESFEDGQALIGELEALGYAYQADIHMPGRHYFVKLKGKLTTHHLHMVSKYSNFWKAHLLFRDHLQANETARKAYATLKYDLAAKYPTDRSAYTEQKAAFIEKVLKDCGYQPELD